MDGRTDDGRKVITIAHPEHSSGELTRCCTFINWNRISGHCIVTYKEAFNWSNVLQTSQLYCSHYSNSSECEGDIDNDLGSKYIPSKDDDSSSEKSSEILKFPVSGKVISSRTKASPGKSGKSTCKQ